MSEDRFFNFSITNNQYPSEKDLNYGLEYYS